MDRGVWWATVCGVSEELDVTEHSYACAIEHFVSCKSFTLSISYFTYKNIPLSKKHATVS